MGTWQTPQSGTAATRTVSSRTLQMPANPAHLSPHQLCVPVLLHLTLIPTSSSCPSRFLGSSSCSSCFRTPPPPIQTAPAPPPLPPPTTIAARKGKRGRTKRRKTRRREKGKESTNPPKPVTAQILIECLCMYNVLKYYVL